MKRFINYTGLVFLLAVSLMSCNSNKSVQEYILEKQSSSDFISLTLPASILNIAVDSLDQEEKEAVASLKKLNVLVYHSPNSNSDVFQQEQSAINTVLKNSSYKDLMKANTHMGSGRIMILGSESKIDEFLAFGSDQKENFILIRVLGNNMNPKHIKPFITALQESNINEDELLGLFSSLKAK